MLNLANDQKKQKIGERILIYIEHVYRDIIVNATIIRLYESLKVLSLV